MDAQVTLTCTACGETAAVAVGGWWTCSCGCSVCAEAPDGVAEELVAIARGHRLRLVLGLAVAFAAALVPGLVLDRGALLLAPVAAAGLFVGVVLPLARRRRELAIGRVPGWSATP